MKWLLTVPVVGLLAAFLVLGWPPETNWGRSDATHDWVTAKAAVDGLDPHGPIGVLLHRYAGEPPGDPDGVPHPRTPAAVLLQVGLLVVPVGQVLVLQTGLVVAAATGLIVLSVRLAGWPAWAVIPASILWFTDPVREAFNTGSQAPLIAVLLTFAWVRVRDGDDVWAGVALAVASCLKLFPLLAVVPLVVLRRKTTAVAGLTFAGLNALALAVSPSMSLSGSVRSLVEAGDAYASKATNLTLIRLLPGPTVLVSAIAAAGVLVWVWYRRPSIDGAFITTTALMLIVSPMVWWHYFVVLVPAVLMLVSEHRIAGAYVAGMWLVMPYAPLWPSVVAYWTFAPVILARAGYQVTRSSVKFVDA